MRCWNCWMRRLHRWSQQSLDFWDACCCNSVVYFHSRSLECRGRTGSQKDAHISDCDPQYPFLLHCTRFLMKTWSSQDSCPAVARRLRARGCQRCSKFCYFVPRIKRRRKSTARDRPPIQTILTQRPPSRCLQGLKTNSKVFRKAPFEINDAMGVKALLPIESDAFWMESKSGEKKRILFSELNQNCWQEIPGYTDQCFALLLPILKGKRAFYYTPKQFLQLTEEI
jgi:hypothetical protein